MKRMLAGLSALTLMAMIVAIPRPAAASHRGHFFGGFAAGTFTGLVLGSAFAPRYHYAPPAVVYQPSPVYVAPYAVYVYPVPPATYVPPQWVWNGYGWVLANRAAPPTPGPRLGPGS